MGSKTFTTFVEVDRWIELASEEMVGSFVLNDSVSPMIGTWNDDLDDEADRIDDAIENGTDVGTGQDLSEILGRLAAAEASINKIKADNQFLSIPYSQRSVVRRRWTTVSNLSVVVSEALAGVWMWTVSCENTADGRAIGVRIVVNGEPGKTAAIDASSRTGDSVVSVTDALKVEVGDVVEIQVIHDISSYATLNGIVKAVKQFSD